MSRVSSVRVEQIPLPGIGMRYDIVTESGRRIGVVSHRTGRRDLVVYDVGDPDTASEQIALTDDEAHTLAEMLSATLVLARLSGLRDQAAGLATEQVSLPADSPYIDRPLRATRIRSRTGAFVVAVLRDGKVIASPGPDTILAAGDVLVVVGTRSGLDAVTQLLIEG